MHQSDTPETLLLLMEAEVSEVLPKFGLAFFSDGKTRTWGATRSTRGPDIGELAEGQRVRLYLQERDGFSIVHHYELVT
ncbi:hypothetical protein [Rhizobacter sp. Root1221]|uniref:hypothetical protein n=1 Tax=Rhizobacter sp. Root1221 TaxID=1736433 RepID=UPI0006F75ACC|nr:hypothetical protein [Rhizobacter sp. Root1221]KQW00103.1 hypothetical protein ASC87_18975 [Rhizobacter sp. Root1221]